MSNTIYKNGLTFLVAPVLSGANITAGSVAAAAVTGVAATLAATQTFAGTNTFSVAPVMSGASITAGSVAAAAVSGVAATLAATQTFAGTNTFSVAPVMSGASISAGSIAAASVSGVAATLAADETFAGVITFTQAPLMSGANIATGSVPASSIIDTAAVLTGGNTFNDTQEIVNALVIDDGATLQILTDPVAGYVLTSDGSGNASWAEAPGVTAIPLTNTTSVTPTAILSLPVGTNSVITVSGKINAAAADYSDATGGEFNVTVVRAGGAAAIVGSPVVFVNASSTGTYAFSIVANALVLSVTAPSTASYNWQGTYDLETN